ncbi:MAG: glycosyl transferase [Beggiatoa sp. IS2]|nr:MAG: glycosyl transferase [Beggiatoa sp. IS2]
MKISHSYQPVIVLIPAKNEEATVGQVIAEIKKFFQGTIVVIDDASTDDTIQVAQTAGAIVLPLAFSLGAWGAIQTGMRYALKHGFNTAITMDADGQHEAEAIAELLIPLITDKSDMVIGACPQRGSIARQIAWAIFRNLSGMTLRDLTSGLRAYNRPAIKVLTARTATLLDYQDVGVLILLRKAGLRIQEVPTQMNLRSNGHSRIFSTWWAVGRYMINTAILCLAQTKNRKKIKCHIN